MLHLWLCTLSFTILKVPYDRGANKLGSSMAPNKLHPNSAKIIHTNQPIKFILKDLYYESHNILANGKQCMTIGGDHTISIGSVSASHDIAIRNNETLGILWCDAHADFNTYEQSKTKNIHGMPVAVLCGHTLKNIHPGKHNVKTDQIAYFGIRDVDKAEQTRLKFYNMTILTSQEDILSWTKNFDKIHISFDVDCIDKNEIQSVNTPCSLGISVKTLTSIFRQIESTKIMSADIVEYNPKLDQKNDAQIVKSIIDIFIN